jgi:hypothetical protein
MHIKSVRTPRTRTESVRFSPPTTPSYVVLQQRRCSILAQQLGSVVALQWVPFFLPTMAPTVSTNTAIHTAVNYVCIIITVAMVMLLNEFWALWTNTTVCLYYFRYSRYSWRVIYYLYSSFYNFSLYSNAVVETSSNKSIPGIRLLVSLARYRTYRFIFSHLVLIECKCQTLLSFTIKKFNELLRKNCPFAPTGSDPTFSIRTRKVSKNICINAAQLQEAYTT